MDKELTCKHCGEGGLHWAEIRGKFTLVNGEGARHSCDKDKLKSYLKPCPFCGSAAQLSFAAGLASVHCTFCYVGSYSHTEEDEARTVWNRRYIHPSFTPKQLKHGAK